MIIYTMVRYAIYICRHVCISSFGAIIACEPYQIEYAIQLANSRKKRVGQLYAEIYKPKKKFGLTAEMLSEI